MEILEYIKSNKSNFKFGVKQLVADIADEFNISLEDASKEVINYLDMESVCIIDFAGNHDTPGMWCDWFPSMKLTRFGGYWNSVPDMKSDTEPTQEQCESHAKQYEDVCKTNYDNYINNSEIIELESESKKGEKNNG